MTTEIKGILLKEVKLPKCPFQAKRLIADLERSAEMSNKYINDRETAGSADIRKGA